MDSIAADPDKTNTLYAATDEGLYESTDGGVKWSRRAARSTQGGESVIVAPTVPTTIYAVVGGVLFKSTDRGSSWIDLGQGADFSRVVVDPSAAATVYAAEGGGLLETTDGGGHWKDLTPAIDEASSGCDYHLGGLFSDPVTGGQGSLYPVVSSPAPRVAYVAWSVFIGLGTWDTCGARTVDGGSTWAAWGGGDVGLAVTGDRASPTTLYAWGREGVARSLDGGTQWSDASGGLPWFGADSGDPVDGERGTVEDLAIDPSGSTVYAVCEGKLFHLRGNGIWTPISVGQVTVTSVAVGANASMLYVGTSRGVLIMSISRTGRD